MTGLWTRRDSAHQNAIDTCRDESLQAGTDKWEDCYRTSYRLTLAMLIDAGDSTEYTPECEECERLPYTRKCFQCS